MFLFLLLFLLLFLRGDRPEEYGPIFAGRLDGWNACPIEPIARKAPVYIMTVIMTAANLSRPLTDVWSQDGETDL
jgi:hypothetical protein